MKKLLSTFIAMLIMAAASFDSEAKEYDATIVSDPGAQ